MEEDLYPTLAGSCLPGFLRPGAPSFRASRLELLQQVLGFFQPAERALRLPKLPSVDLAA